jgi:hypothetical protein
MTNDPGPAPDTGNDINPVISARVQASVRSAAAGNLEQTPFFSTYPAVHVRGEPQLL